MGVRAVDKVFLNRRPAFYFKPLYPLPSPPCYKSSHPLEWFKARRLRAICKKWIYRKCSNIKGNIEARFTLHVPSLCRLKSTRENGRRYIANKRKSSGYAGLCRKYLLFERCNWSQGTMQADEEQMRKNRIKGQMQAEEACRNTPVPMNLGPLCIR